MPKRRLACSVREFIQKIKVDFQVIVFMTELQAAQIIKALGLDPSIELNEHELRIATQFVHCGQVSWIHFSFDFAF